MLVLNELNHLKTYSFNPYNYMKNIHLFLPVIYFLVLITSCGPSKEEIEAHEKHIQDSISKIQQQEFILQQHTDNTIQPPPPNPQKTYNNNADFVIGIYSVNGCEYISFRSSETCNVLHAGNCCNPIHTKQTTSHHEDFPIN